MNEMFKKIQKDIQDHRVLLYMKGNRFTPQCGYSARVVAILNQLNVNFETRDVLQDNQLRTAIKEFSNWPTLPQLYIDGKLIGGCDIVCELFELDELQKYFK